MSGPYIEARAGMDERQGSVVRLLLAAQSLRAAVEHALELGMPPDLMMEAVDGVMFGEDEVVLYEQN